MADNTAKDLLKPKEKPEQKQKNGEVVSINKGKLLKIRHSTEKIKQLKQLFQELERYKTACSELNALTGEINDQGGKQEG